MESWETIMAVQRMQDCIEKHLTEPISLYMLAQAAGYSPWHAARIFKEFTGKTPFEYIRTLRLTRAALKLRAGYTRVVDVLSTSSLNRTKALPGFSPSSASVPTAHESAAAISISSRSRLPGTTSSNKKENLK
jgi:AraC-like DNA-binding protein